LPKSLYKVLVYSVYHITYYFYPIFITTFVSTWFCKSHTVINVLFDSGKKHIFIR